MSTVDLTTIGPDELATLVNAATVEDLRLAVDAVGTDAALERLFSEFPARFKPTMGGNVNATFEFVVDGEHHYGVTIANGACTVDRGVVESPTTQLRCDAPLLLQLIVGKADGPTSFMSGKLKLTGDIMLASRLLTFFERPGA